MSRTPTEQRIDSLLADLTESQAEAVQHTNGPLLVLAGAGAGKTRVITRRAAYLGCTVTPARNVLAITFTNKAAEEMRERMLAMGVGREMTVCTFHSLAARLLRIHHENAGLPEDFTIFDVRDQRLVLKAAIERVALSADNWTPAKVQTVISNAKNAMVTAERFADHAADWGQRNIAQIYTMYEKILAEQHALDFDDLLLKLALLLRNDTELCGKIEQRYTHVLIDEYQDTNSAQYEIAHLITRQNRNLCATGDPDQSIYGWRGADIENILSFEKDHPDAKVVRLEQNYRSTKRILAAASGLIENNVSRKEKSLWTENPQGSRVRVVSFEDAEDEAEFIARDIVDRNAKGEDLGDIAVFYRLNSLSRAIEESLIKEGVAYQVARGTEFYARKEIKDVLAYTRIVVNPHDEVSLLRCINTPARGIGKTTVDRLVAHARAAGKPLFEVVLEPEQVPELKKAAVTRVTGFAMILKSIALLREASPRSALEQILSLSGLQAALNKDSEVDPEPALNVGELVNATKVFEDIHPDSTLLEWLEHTSLLGDVDSVEEDKGRVTLMTLHAAKGLEFPVVYIIALEDGLLPFYREDRHTDCDEEEERRLCFVGMTRSKRELTLSYSRYRMVRGITERKVASPFVKELPRREIECLDDPFRSAKSGSRHKRGGELPSDIHLWDVGALVRHPSYGLGRVMWLRPNGAQVQLGVEFQSGEQKTFILQFAELERVDFDEVDY